MTHRGDTQVKDSITNIHIFLDHNWNFKNECLNTAKFLLFKHSDDSRIKMVHEEAKIIWCWHMFLKNSTLCTKGHQLELDHELQSNMGSCNAVQLQQLHHTPLNLTAENLPISSLNLFMDSVSKRNAIKYCAVTYTFCIT